MDEPLKINYTGMQWIVKSRDPEKIANVKGMQAFILSVEKNGYEQCYSEGMLHQIHEYGFRSLKELIDSFD